MKGGIKVRKISQRYWNYSSKLRRKRMRVMLSRFINCTSFVADSEEIKLIILRWKFRKIRWCFQFTNKTITTFADAGLIWKHVFLLARTASHHFAKFYQNWLSGSSSLEFNNLWPLLPYVNSYMKIDKLLVFLAHIDIDYSAKIRFVQIELKLRLVR